VCVSTRIDAHRERCAYLFLITMLGENLISFVVREPSTLVLMRQVHRSTNACRRDCNLRPNADELAIVERSTTKGSP